ncbi:hypothetical protein ES288_D10G109800v1 [Gossypium darwinii]|uniref:Uncharacterized protein n=1 Tax=Gossypium darwinii TaxID=34276 RepID=A0A5D2AXL2_GOSDA|nr:hypothetical protein ES288_D10G109800v1 [Gossypium darwinii]
MEDAKEQIVQESKNSTLPSQDERMFCLLGMKIWFRLIRKMKNFRTNDPLLWRDIHINPPLNEKITDDVLLQITGRGQGSLQCLSLVDCQRITDEGLKRVVENNPKLIKPCFQ